MNVSEIMSPAPYCLNEQDSVQQAAQAMRVHNIGALPVCRDQQLVGLITDRDIAIGCVAGGHPAAECQVVQHMTANPVRVSPEASVQDAALLMGAEQVRRLCVVDNNGQIAGMLSIGDIAVHMPGDPLIAQTLAQISQGVRGGTRIAA